MNLGKWVGIKESEVGEEAAASEWLKLDNGHREPCRVVCPPCWTFGTGRFQHPLREQIVDGG